MEPIRNTNTKPHSSILSSCNATCVSRRAWSWHLGDATSLYDPACERNAICIPSTTILLLSTVLGIGETCGEWPKVKDFRSCPSGQLRAIWMANPKENIKTDLWYLYSNPTQLPQQFLKQRCRREFQMPLCLVADIPQHACSWYGKFWISALTWLHVEVFEPCIRAGVSPNRGWIAPLCCGHGFSLHDVTFGCSQGQTKEWKTLGLVISKFDASSEFVDVRKCHKQHWQEVSMRWWHKRLHGFETCWGHGVVKNEDWVWWCGWRGWIHLLILSMLFYCLCCTCFP